MVPSRACFIPLAGSVTWEASSSLCARRERRCGQCQVASAWRGTVLWAWVCLITGDNKATLWPRGPGKWSSFLHLPLTQVFLAACRQPCSHSISGLFLEPKQVSIVDVSRAGVTAERNAGRVPVCC